MVTVMEADIRGALLPPTYSGASPLKGCTLPKLSMVVGIPPSMERFTIWSKVTSSTVWN